MTDVITILSFQHPTALELAGGKGLNLARLYQAGMPVPPGFIISTAAYTAFMRFNHLDDLISGLFSFTRQNTSWAEVSGKIRSGFAAGEFPGELADEIVRSYRELCQLASKEGLAVAVRSSATAEDLAEASFAGQQDTYLNICGETAVLNAVRCCFGSLWSERAIDYRARHMVNPIDVRLAVVVQQMIFAQAAGVIFTANPINGDDHQLIIDATYGLGEALVSGLVTPDHMVLDKRTGMLLSYSLAKKTMMIAPTVDGTHEQPVPALKQNRRVLNSANIRRLLELGTAIEKFYDCPQDLEWCLAGGKVYIVQARPITTLPEHPVCWDAPGKGLWMHGGGTFEMITEPVSPLFETFLLPIFLGEVNKLLEESRLTGVLPTDPYRVLNGFIYLHMDLHLRPWHIGGILRDFAIHFNSMKDQEAEETLYRTSVAELIFPAAADLTDDQILDRMQALGRAAMHYWMQIVKIVQVIYRQEKAFFDFYNRRVRRTGDPEAEIFLRGQKILPWEAECSTYDLAQQARKHGDVVEILNAQLDAAQTSLKATPHGQEFLAALEVHLNRFGHQLSSFDPALPTLADDPRPVLVAVQAFLNAKESPFERHQRMAQECEQAISAILPRLPAFKQAKFRQLLDAARAAASTRENALFHVGLAWTQMHRCALELGNRLTTRGSIQQPKDIFWLTLAEIKAALERKDAANSEAKIIAERQANHSVWSRVEAPYLLPVGSRSVFWWKWIFPTPELQRHPDAKTLVGLGVSPGKVTGVARVIHSLDEMEELNPGEILVAHTTTPAWTPLFARAAGLVTDLGGPLAHGSIVAREYGIPAIMGTGTATQKIRSGQTITLYGSEGKVTLE